jgi:hypothetical protein
MKEEPKKKKNKGITILIFLLTLTIGIAGGYIVFDKFLAEEKETENKEQNNKDDVKGNEETNNNESDDEVIDLGLSMWEKGIASYNTLSKEIFSEEYCNVEPATSDFAFIKMDKECFNKIEEEINTVFTETGANEWKSFVFGEYIEDENMLSMNGAQKYLIKNDEYYRWECRKSCITADNEPVLTIKTKTSEKIVFNSNHHKGATFSESDPEKTENNEFIIVKNEDDSNNEIWKIEKMTYIGD